MLKKNSWIVALLLALSLTAFLFTGCVNPLKVEEDTETYEEYPLDKGYNAWAGQVYQKGWAIGGIKFQGKGDAIVVAKDLGYDIEMFQKATKLKIEMPDASYPRSGVDIIWGGEDETGDSTKGGGMWNQQPIAGGSGDVDTTFAKKDGNVLIIDLTKALKNYSAYTKAAKLKIVMQVNAPSYGDVEGLVQKAFLMIPNTPPPYVGVSKISLVNNYMYYTSLGFELVPKVERESATNKTVNWQLVGWGPEGSASPTLTLPDKLDPFDSASVTAYNAAKAALLAKVDWKKESYVIDDSLGTPETGLRPVVGTVIAPDGFNSIGKVWVNGVIKEGSQNKTTGKFSNFEQKLTFEIRDPPFFKFKIDGVEYKTKKWGAVDNGGVSGGWMDVNLDEGSTTEGSSYTITLGGSYHNSHHYFELDLSSLSAGSNKISDYTGVRVHYKGLTGDCDLVGKNIRVRAMLTPPPREYNIGPFLSSIGTNTNNQTGKGYPVGANTKDLDLDFKFFKDDANMYGGGAGANMPDPQVFNNTTLSGDSDFAAVKGANKIYVWFSPHAADKGKDNKSTTFTISNVEFYK